MSISYAAVALKVKSLLASRGREIGLALYDAQTTPDASKPWRQTSAAATKTFTVNGLALDDESDARSKTVYVPPPDAEPDVVLDERYIVTVGDEKFSIVGMPVRIDPDGTNILWIIKCKGWVNRPPGV